MPRPRTITDEQLLEAALEAVYQDGPEGLTLASVGKRAGVSAATLVQRFGSKDNLLEQMIVHANQKLEDGIPDPLEPAEKSLTVEELVGWLVAAAKPLHTRELMASHLWVLRQDLLDPAMRAHAQRFGALLRKRIEVSLRSLCPQESDAWHEERAWFIEAHWHGLIWQWALSGDGELAQWLGSGLRRALANWS